MQGWVQVKPRVVVSIRRIVKVKQDRASLLFKQMAQNASLSNS
jgi:hypothetical protein